MQESVRDYYGKTLSSSDDLQTNACCDQAPPGWLKPILASLHDEVISRYYGCGLVAPAQPEGARILDLGCGSGRDVYVLSALAGEQGEVVGVDMTPEQLAVARRHQDFHRDAFGYARSNATFLEGEIEWLDRLDLAKLCGFRDHFRFIGDFSRHFGIFPDCGTPMPFAESSADSAAGGCC